MPATPATATVATVASGSGGGGLGRTLLIAAALGLLGIALVPTRVIAQLGLERDRAASARVAFAVAGLSVGLGYLIAMILNESP